MPKINAENEARRQRRKELSEMLGNLGVMGILNGLKNRGVDDILVACVDGLIICLMI